VIKISKREESENMTKVVFEKILAVTFLRG
jgi:hypothetical protein